MRLMKRNMSTIYFCLFKGREPILDDDGNETSEVRLEYEKPTKLLCSVSPAAGNIQATMFGNLESYDKIMITDDITCPIDENTVLYVDSEPSDSNSYDYIVKRVAKSLNTISYAISKVKVS